MKLFEDPSDSIDTKLQAFTLIEVIVVLAISIFFIGIVYSSVTFYLSLIQKNKTESEARKSIIELQSNLTHEAGTSMVIQCNQRDSVLQIVTSNLDTTSYWFRSGSIVRRQKLRMDTLSLSVKNISFLWHGTTINQGYVDQINFQIIYAKTLLSILITKEYAPDIMYNFIENKQTPKEWKP